MDDLLIPIKHVIDTHVHLTTDKLRNQLIDSPPDAWKEGLAKSQVYNYKMFEEEINKSICQLDACIYVQCFNYPAIDECCWAINFAKSNDNIVRGVVAEIPVPQGAEAVTSFLQAVQARCGESALPRELKGGRVVLLGQAENASLDSIYVEGLTQLHQAGLHWEFCCHPGHIPYILATCKRCPKDMVFVLDHLLHNSAGDTSANDFESWSVNIAKLAREIPNTYCKIGAVEEWGCSEPYKYLEFAIEAFGYDRVLYESNWFVSRIVGGSKYDDTAKLLCKVLLSRKASRSEIENVFYRNAKKVYKL